MSASISASSTLFATTNAQREAKRTDLGQDSFLRLMTEQLKNQDPLKPLASNEFLGQLAQFSTVKGIENLQKTFAGVVSALGSDQNLKAADLIGRSALVAADYFQLDGSGAMDGAIFAPGPGTVTVDINDSQGQLVRRIQATASGAGDIDFHWDGKDANGVVMPTGQYQLQASYAGPTGSSAAIPMVAARIDSVSLTPSGLVLNLAGLGSIAFTAIRRLS